MDHIGIDLLSTFVPQLGLGVFIWYLLQGLSRQVDALKSVVNAQKDTIEVMGRRIEETEKIGGIYKTLLADLPGELDSYNLIVIRRSLLPQKMRLFCNCKAKRLQQSKRQRTQSVKSKK
jgi:hypothetical protein